MGQRPCRESIGAEALVEQAEACLIRWIFQVSVEFRECGGQAEGFVDDAAVRA